MKLSVSPAQPDTTAQHQPLWNQWSVVKEIILQVGQQNVHHVNLDAIVTQITQAMT